MFDPPQLALSLAGLSRAGESPWAGSPKAMLSWAAANAHRAGVRAMVLDATRPEFRPRELGPGARRDLAGALRRLEVGFAGIDLFLPPMDLIEPETLDRAADAVLGAIGLAADLAGAEARGGGRVVSVVLPQELCEDVLSTLADEAARQGVRLANHAWPIEECDPQSSVLAGMDPVRAIEAQQSPGKAAARAGDQLAAARLSDRDQSGRCAVGDGELDVLGYAAALATIKMPSVTIDLRGLVDPADAISSAARAWTEAFGLPG